MKKKISKNRSSGFDGGFDSGQGSKGVAKDKSSKKRLSIYDDYEEDDDIFLPREKFKSRNK
jgi:hypothetical protein